MVYRADASDDLAALRKRVNIRMSLQGVGVIKTNLLLTKEHQKPQYLKNT